MTDETATAIPISDYPDPVFAYTLRDNEPSITTSNRHFEQLVGDRTAETVTELFETYDVVDATDAAGPLGHFRRGEAGSIYLDDRGERGPFVARVAPTSENEGYVVFTPVDDCPDVMETVGVGDVASVISHDLRNPLDVAEAHLRAARETGDREHFEQVARSHDRMERIIRDVLTLDPSRSVVTRSEQVDVETAVEDAWRSVETDRATLDIADSLPTTKADPDRLRRLFENLFRNSLEHGDQAGDGTTVTITIGTLENGFYVADDGTGIPQDEQDRVFEPGYSTKDRGTGLGLAIVERIAAVHEWAVTLTTASNGGARFEVRF
ncbi:MAG: sensor histidine kinase [Halapricum sp.]